jgi:hypothetical protein
MDSNITSPTDPFSPYMLEKEGRGMSILTLNTFVLFKPNHPITEN